MCQRIYGALTSDEQQTLHIIASRTQFEDPALWEKIRNWLIEKDPQLEVIYTQWIETEYWPGRREEQKLLMRVLFAISPLHRVMLRHTRSLLEQYRKYNLLTERLATVAFKDWTWPAPFFGNDRSAISLAACRSTTVVMKTLR